MATTPPITFDYAYWVASYPEFAACSSGQGQAWFDRSTLFFWNDRGNPAWCAGEMLFKQYIYLLVSHIAWLNAPRDAQGNPAASGTPAPSIVGRVNSATEGSVSVSSEWNGSGSPTESWYLQTKYGAEFWTATAPYRTARYAALPTVVAGAGPYPFPYAAYRGRRGC